MSAEIITDVKNDISKITTNPVLKIGIWALLCIVIGIAGILFLPAVLSSYPAIIGNVGCALGVIWFIDKFVLKGYDIVNAIKTNPEIAKVFLMMIGLVIAASIIAS